jgi:MFS family permease
LRSEEIDHVKLPPSTYILSLAQAINLTAAVISVTIAALVGTRLARSPALGTVPYGAQFASVMLCTYPVSMLMRKIGRRPVFSIGGMLLIAAGAIGYVAIACESFWLLILAHVLLGCFVACANFYRFAAVDGLPSTIKAKGISLVVAGGVLAAILGPAVADGLRDVRGFTEFSLCYGVLCLLGVATLALITNWRPEKTSASSMSIETAVKRSSERFNWAIPAAIAASAGGYFAMNLLMVQASLVMARLCSFEASSQAIQAHVLAMFAPSFITAKIIDRIGLRLVLLLGSCLIVAAAGSGAMPLSYSGVFTGLVLLGLGWNFSYVGGGSLLSSHLNDENRHRWQGINDTTIAACATLGAFLPSVLLSTVGWSVTNTAIIVLTIGSALFSFWAINRETEKKREETAGAGV